MPEHHLLGVSDFTLVLILLGCLIIAMIIILVLMNLNHIHLKNEATYSNNLDNSRIIRLDTERKREALALENNFIRKDLQEARISIDTLTESNGRLLTQAKYLEKEYYKAKGTIRMLNDKNLALGIKLKELTDCVEVREEGACAGRIYREDDEDKVM